MLLYIIPEIPRGQGLTQLPQSMRKFLRRFGLRLVGNAAIGGVPTSLSEGALPPSDGSLCDPASPEGEGFDWLVVFVTAEPEVTAANELRTTLPPLRATLPSLRACAWEVTSLRSAAPAIHARVSSPFWIAARWPRRGVYNNITVIAGLTRNPCASFSAVLDCGS
jgi:hypothetical protein